MSLRKYPALQKFLVQSIQEMEPGEEAQAVERVRLAIKQEDLAQLEAQLAAYLSDEIYFTEELGMEANRWFDDEDEARAWLQNLAQLLSKNETGATRTVKDSNGAVLIDGDSVTVIKDLKVKGGPSDLKRGTLIKKIRFIGDPNNIECNVGGSTLVLKTIFLKKA